MAMFKYISRVPRSHREPPEDPPVQAAEASTQSLATGTIDHVGAGGVEPGKDLVDDVATYVGKSISDANKYHLLKHHFRPDAQYKFPQDSSTKRSFQLKWLNNNNWLVYSKEMDGGFCLPCVLFATGYRAQDPGILVSRPLRNFGKALELLNKHRAKDYHAGAIARCQEFEDVMDQEKPNIRRWIDRGLAQRVSTNRRRLLSIVKTLTLCGRQNIPIRGHRDNTKDVLEEGDIKDGTGHGNFWALLQFRIDAGDTELSDHIANAPRNAMYISPGIQNQIVSVLGDHIRDQILRN